MKRIYFSFFCLIALVILFAVPYLKSVYVNEEGLFYMNLYDLIVLYITIFSPAILAAIILPIIAIWIIRKYKKS